MTYQEIKDRLSKCENELKSLKERPNSNLTVADINSQIKKLTVLKEIFKIQLNEEGNTIITTKKGATKVVPNLDKKQQQALKDDPNINSIETTDGMKIKEGGFDQNETASIAANVGKAVVLALNSMGEGISSARVINIKPDSFNVRIVFRNDNEEVYEFYINEDDRLILKHSSYDRDLADVGAKPSGEAVVNVDVVKDAFSKELENIMAETMTDQEFRDAKEKERLEKHPEKDTIKKIQALIARERRLKNTKEEVEEGEYAADKYNVNVFGYQTKHYKICPGAKAFMQKVVDGEFGKVDKQETIRLAKLHDLLFMYEIKALKDSEYAANILTQAEYVAGEIERQVQDMGLPVDEVDYLEAHIEKISDAASETDYVKRRRDDDYSESTNEREGDDHHYIKVSKADFKKAEKIISQNIDGNNVKMDYVDDDGAGNVIIYFMFNDGDIASGEANSFMNDVVMDLEAYDIRINDHSAEMDEAELSKAEKGKLKDMSKSLKKSSKGHAGQAKYIDKLVKEGRGDMDIIKGIIRDRANESGFEEREEAAEVIAGIAEEYMLSLKVIQAYMDSDGPVNPFDVNELDESRYTKIRDYYRKIDQMKKGSEEEIDNIKRMNPKADKKSLKKIAKMGKEKKDEVSENADQDEALDRLREIVDTLEDLGSEARDLVRQNFPNEMSRMDGYGVFNFAYSNNRYDTTIGSEVDRLEDSGYDDLDDEDYPSEALDSDLPKGKHSIAKLQKVHGMIVSKMKELAKLYKEKGGEYEYRGHSVIDHLKSMTKKKKQVEDALDKAVSGKNRGQQLDPNVDEAAITEPIKLQDALERYSFGEILDTAVEFYTQEGEKDVATLAKQAAIKFRKMLDDFDGGVTEKAPGFMHDCASKVVHEKHGKGTCIPEQHTLVKEGNKYVVTHYDVLFESGKTVKNIPVDELNVITSSHHGHKRRKK